MTLLPYRMSQINIAFQSGMYYSLCMFTILIFGSLAGGTVACYVLIIRSFDGL